MPLDRHKIETIIETWPVLTFEQAIEIGIAIRQFIDKSEELYMRYLQRLDLSGLWQSHTGKGASTFDNFLRLHLNTDPIRYRNGLRALELIDSETISRIGFDAAKQAAHVSDPTMRAKILTACDQHVEEHGGGPVPNRSAIQIVSSVVPSQNPSVRLDERLGLRAEVTALRQRVAQLQRLLAEYRERFGELPKPAPARKPKKPVNPRKR
jgi:hypothetical protein